jgi:hypothetical protein
MQVLWTMLVWLFPIGVLAVVACTFVHLFRAANRNRPQR